MSHIIKLMLYLSVYFIIFIIIIYFFLLFMVVINTYHAIVKYLTSNDNMSVKSIPHFYIVKLGYTFFHVCSKT